MHRNIYIQILNGTAPDTSPLYCASETPFTVTYQKPMPTDVIFHAIEDLRDGLMNRFGVPELMVPAREDFEATADEREIGDDPIYRTVAF